MSLELVDATMRVGGDRRLIDAARSWAPSMERSQAARFYRDLMHVSEYRAYELADVARGSEIKEQQAREAEQAERLDRASVGLWLDARRNAEANREAGLPEDTPRTQRLGLFVPTVERGDTRWALADPADPAAGVVPVDPSEPDGAAQFFDGTDYAYQAQQRPPVTRSMPSLSAAHEEQLLARAREHSRDSFMLIQVSRARSRRTGERWAAEDAEAARASRSRRVPSGTGWPEYEISR